MSVNVLHIVKRKGLDSYLESPSRNKETKDIQKAIRSFTASEADRLRKLLSLPVAWKVVAVEYDTCAGRVVGVVKTEPAETGNPVG